MYKSLESFRAEKRLARAERDRYADALTVRWARLQDPATRGVLLRDAVADALRSWTPYRKVQELLHGRVSGEMVSSLGMAAAGMHRSWTKRLMYTGISLLLGKAIGRNGVPEGAGLVSSFVQGVGAFMKRVQERRARRNAEEEAPPVED